MTVVGGAPPAGDEEEDEEWEKELMEELKDLQE